MTYDETLSDYGPLVPRTPYERERAAISVASRSRDVDDAREMLDALGLLDEFRANGRWRAGGSCAVGGGL